VRHLDSVVDVASGAAEALLPRDLNGEFEALRGPMPGMADLVKALSENHRLVLLSNADHYYWQVVQAMQSELQVLTELLVSCDLGCAKPDPKAFLSAGQAAGADPAQCLFVDDTRVNVKAAQALGFQTHWFRDVPGLHRTLQGSTTEDV
jgi:HAD superfamily hydrolase (TIGR01509 family)